MTPEAHPRTRSRARQRWKGVALALLLSLATAALAKRYPDSAWPWIGLLLALLGVSHFLLRSARPRVVAVFAEEDWPAVRTRLPDGPQLPESYARYREELDRDLAEATRLSGTPFQLQTIQLALFEQWASDRGLDLDAAARTRYAEERWWWG